MFHNLQILVSIKINDKWPINTEFGRQVLHIDKIFHITKNIMNLIYYAICVQE